jgi:SAM-dependent methyltransferase
LPKTVACRVCDGKKLEPVIDLGLQPWGNHFLRKNEVGKEPFYPLRVCRCADCATAQLDFTVPKETMFADHTYLSGTTKSLSAHFEKVAAEVDRRFGKGKKKKTVLDIGSNDGTQLKHYLARGWDVLGVESSKTAFAAAKKAGVPTLHKFYNAKTQGELCRKFDVINASGVFFHLEELHSVCEGIKAGLKEDGVFVVQFLYFKSIIENGAFDQIYHEHLLYYTLETVERLLNRHGLGLFDAEVSPIHGGSVIGYAGKKARRPVAARLSALRKAEAKAKTNELKTQQAFQDRVELMKAKDRSFLLEEKRAGRRVFGMGAPVKGNTLLNYFGIGPGLLSCLVERNPLRRGLYSPGMHVPVALEDELKGPPDTYYVLAWNFKDEILKRYADLVKKGVRFYFPVEPKAEAKA